MKWQTIAPRFREHAHKLRKALMGALELDRGGKWGRDAVESAGRRDYRAVFGHDISAKTFWRALDLAKQRAGENGDWTRLEYYLPVAIAPSGTKPAFEKAAADMPTLRQAVVSVGNAAFVTEIERNLIWVSACEEWRRINDAGASSVKAQKLVLGALLASGVDLGKSAEALRKSFKRKLERWIEGGYTAESLRDLRAESSGAHSALPISDDDRRLLTARALQGSLSRAWRDTLNQGELSADATQAFIANPSCKSYVPQRVRNLVGPAVAMLDDLHHGPRQAALKGAYISRDWSTVGPGDWYSADDTTLPLYYWHEDEQGRPQVMRGQCLIMVDCRTNRILTFALHSERNYTAKTIRGLILKTHDTYGLPRKGFYFENGTWSRAKLLKGVALGDEVPADETELGLREWVEFKHAKPGNARAKTVERIIGLVQDRMEDQPGYCGRNEQIEKFEGLQRKLLDVKAGRIHPRDFLLHRDEWVTRLSGLCDSYNQERQDGRMLGGLSPREAWDSLFDAQQPLMRLNDETRYLLANHRRPLKVTRNGICIQIGKERLWFRNEITGRLVGRTVQAYFNPDDVSSIFVKLTPDDSTASIIPAAPVIPAMGATRDQMHSARASVEAHASAARTMYQEIKPYFKDNAPSPFRRIIADQASVELGAEIAADQAAIRETQGQQAATRRKIARFERAHHVETRVPVSDERKLAAFKLLEEANQDADA